MSDSRATAAMPQAGQQLVAARALGRIPNRNPVYSSEAPLSYGQESIWLEEQASPGSSSYNISAAFRIRGPLSTSALQWAFAEIIRRHEILRTTFHVVEDVPRQIISPAREFVLAIEELPGGIDEAQIAEWVEQQTTAPFDLTAGPLMRVKLLRAGIDDHVVAVSMHHIISDGWSQLVLLREMMMLYEAHCRRTTPLLSVLDLQYADFAVWQRDFLKTETIEQQLGYWKQQLADAPPLLSLPLDRSRPPAHTRRGAIEPFSISRPVVEKLRQVGRQEDATLFITLMAAFQMLLHQYSGQDDIVVGTPYLGRNSQQLAGSIGLFLNTLSIRVKFDGSCSFRDILRRTRESCLGAFANSAVPFARVVAAVNPVREASYNPIFQAWFLLENRSSQSTPASPGLEVVPLTSVDASAKFDLLFVANESSSAISGHLRYNTDLFRPETIKTMAAAFTTILRLLIDSPDTPCAELPISPAILMQEPDTESEAEKDLPVELRFEQMAARNPLQAAVIADGKTWNYGELNQAANRLARRLQELGAKPEAAVLVRVERSGNSVLATLAIQKAGAVYVPVDAAEPRERVRQILERVQPVVVITQKNLSGDFELSSNSSVVCIDCSDSELERVSDENLLVPADGDNLAYVIFTSGSTGKPKGVAVSRGALASHCSRIIQRFRLVNSDHVLQFANTAFDVSIEQVLPTLAVGAAVYLRGNTQWSAAELFNVMQEWRLTVANLPTAYWQTVASEWSRSQCRLHSDFRLMIIGGEAMSPAAAERWLSCGQSGELLNAYGPTEAVITTSFLTVTAGVSEWAGSSVPVDKPLPDRWGIVLNERLQPVPAGAPGELCIGGNLARGYLGMAVETAERFVPNPFAETEGERLYRTGDVVRLRPDGTLDFLGRRDYQIKLRGYRIELEEIESALKKVPGVADAVAKIWQSDDAQPRLVAYVTSSSAPLSEEDIREKLKVLLPEFMMPSAIVMLESMPMTISGKIDRRSLPAPVVPISNVPAQDSIEEEVLELFKKILRVPSIGRSDDFFEAGGHSLLAVQLVGKIRERFGVKVSLATIFRLRTGSALAGELRELKRKEPVKQKAGTDAAMRRADRSGPLPLSYAQERLWFVEQLQPGGAAYNMPITLRLRGPLDGGALEQAFSKIVQRHEILRTT
ncbi:MAG TPA: amino acid adenylation domain-containing protein, partial [Candidatus Angelobacter sp.]|nr:amino acid adenylation domain-containing protein [Candidatus Angelobacter sp.]